MSGLDKKLAIAVFIFFLAIFLEYCYYTTDFLPHYWQVGAFFDVFAAVSYLAFIFFFLKRRYPGKPFIEKSVSYEIRKIFSKEYLPVMIILLIAVLIVVLGQYSKYAGY